MQIKSNADQTPANTIWEFKAAGFTTYILINVNYYLIHCLVYPTTIVLGLWEKINSKWWGLFVYRAKAQYTMCLSFAELYVNLHGKFKQVLRWIILCTKLPKRQAASALKNMKGQVGREF